MSASSEQATAASREGAVAVSRAQWTQRGADAFGDDDSLVARCRAVIVSNMERYPPGLFGLLEEEEWDELVKLRHRKTCPKEGSGGLDGTGRIAPAITAKYLAQVEEECPQLAESDLADQLVWKDCVEYKFKRAGLTRPKALTYPWPLLVETLREATTSLLELLGKDLPPNEVKKIVANSHAVLKESPMNISLLKASGVGKTVKKFISKSTIFPDSGLLMLDQFNALLKSWMDLAASSGVEMKEQRFAKKGKSSSKDSKFTDKDLKLAESCHSWRELYAALTKREEQRRSNQGARMREIRRNLKVDRPKIMKVRPTSAKHQRILQRKAATSGFFDPSSSKDTSKILQLRKETSIAAARQKGPIGANKAAAFATAVAFTNGDKAHLNKRKANRKAAPGGAVVALGGGKRMKVPQSARSTVGIKQGSSLRQKLSKPTY